MKKKKTVENDKKKIEEVIKDLDEKKNEALRTAWVQVNRVSCRWSRSGSGDS